MKRLLFLDIDGVLNSLDRWQFVKTKHDDNIDPVLVKRVHRLVEQTDAQIVLSTAWRSHFTIDVLKQMLKRNGLQQAHRRVVGKTIESSWRLERGREIEHYLLKHNTSTRVAVLDDNDGGEFNMDAVRPWFVQTDPRHGVRTKDINRARILLTDGPVWLPPAAIAVA